eukprot:790666-Rhodomonas_salina.1
MQTEHEIVYDIGLTIYYGAIGTLSSWYNPLSAYAHGTACPAQPPTHRYAARESLRAKEFQASAAICLRAALRSPALTRSPDASSWVELYVLGVPKKVADGMMASYGKMAVLKSQATVKAMDVDRLLHPAMKPNTAHS